MADTQPTAAPAVNTGKFATSFSMEVNKKNEKTGKFELIGSIPVFVPTLADAGFNAEQAKDDKGEPMYEDGIPVYVDDVSNWLQSAIVAQTKAQARNKLISGTVTLKDGKSIADDWATLTAEADNAGGAAALIARRDTIALFTKWTATLGKSQGAQSMINQLFSTKAVQVQSPENKQKMLGYINEFVESLSAADLEKGAKYIEQVKALCEVVEDAKDF